MKARGISFLLLIIFILNTNSAYAQIGKIYPVDESKNDSLFYSYYLSLCKAVEGRNINSLIPLLNDSLYITNELNAYVPVEQFLSYYKETNDNELWDLFDALLSVGGGRFVTKNGIRYYYAPYTSIALVDEKNNEQLFEVGEYSVVIDSCVKMYCEKNVESKIISILSYDIVKNTGSLNDREWFEVELNNGIKGYIQKDFIRNLFDVRAEFVLKKGEWKLYLLGYFD